MGCKRHLAPCQFLTDSLDEFRGKVHQLWTGDPTGQPVTETKTPELRSTRGRYDLPCIRFFETPPLGPQNRAESPLRPVRRSVIAA